jgi:hypothetical protein
MSYQHPFITSADCLPRLVKYDCGCVGLPPIDTGGSQEAMVFIVYVCDAYDSPFCLTVRPMRKDKLHLAEPLSDNRNTAIWMELQLLVGHGLAYREAGRILKDILKAGETP